MPLKEVGAWIAPWLVGVFLVGATLLGFLTASDARRSDTYAAGIVTGVLALVALAWLVKRSFDQNAEDWPLKILVDRLESLVLLIVVLTVIGIGGLFLAANTGGALQMAGYALFVVCLLLIAWNIKHYYDRADSRRSGNDGALD